MNNQAETQNISLAAYSETCQLLSLNKGEWSLSGQINAVFKTLRLNLKPVSIRT
jgi:hypothetical protein